MGSDSITEYINDNSEKFKYNFICEIKIIGKNEYMRLVSPDGEQELNLIRR
jgi:hypothetical protein